MSRNNEHERQCLVLNVSYGCRFDCFKNVLLKVSAKIQDEQLTSHLVQSSPQPLFKINFVWHTTAKHINQLRDWCSNIEIELTATSSTQTWTAGHAMFGIQHAQVMCPNVVLTTHRVPVYSTRPVPLSVLKPELIVTLSIHSEPLWDLSCRSYHTNLPETSEPRNSSVRLIQRPTRAAMATTTVQGEQSKRSWDLLSEDYHLKTIQNSRTGSPKQDDHRPITYDTANFSNEEEELLQEEDLCEFRNLSLDPERYWFPRFKIGADQDKKIVRKIKEPVTTMDLKNNTDRKHNKGIATTSSSSTTISIEGATALKKEETLKSHLLPKERGVPSRIFLATLNTHKSEMEPLGLYGSSSTFQMIGEPPPTRLPEVLTPIQRDRISGNWNIVDELSTSTSPPVQKIVRKIKEPVTTMDLKNNTDRKNNKGIATTSSSSSTITIEGATAFKKGETLKSHSLPKERGVPSKIFLATLNTQKSQMEPLGLYGSSSTFQMIGQPPPTRLPEVLTPKQRDHKSANWNIMDEPSTSSSPPVQYIPEDET